MAPGAGGVEAAEGSTGFHVKGQLGDLFFDRAAYQTKEENMAAGKDWTSVMLMPVVVALVGIIGTSFVTAQQESSEKARAVAEREVKLIEIFANKITGQKADEKILALRLLRVLEPSLAQKLGEAALDSAPEASVREVAKSVVQEATARAQLLSRIYLHIQKEEDREGAKKVAEQLKGAGYFVPGIERLVNAGPGMSQVRYFRKAEADEAGKIVKLLANDKVPIEAQYISGYENSDSIRPRHYEIWFAAGQPGR